MDHWQSLNNKIRIIYTLTDCQPKDKACIFGRINDELLKSRIDDLYERIFFIFGPPSMVEAISNLCIGLGCKKECLKTENFIGY